MKNNNNLKNGASLALIHLCSPQSLYKILSSKIFTPIYSDPLAGDSGINTLIDDGRRHHLGQGFKGTGAKLKLEWTGPVKLASQNERYPLQPGVLHDWGSWRGVIPAGTDSEMIRVVGFEVHDNKLGQLTDSQQEELRSIGRSLQRQGPLCLSLG